MQKSVHTQIARTLQYLYFIRFSILLWLFPFGFALLDSGWLPLSTTTLSRGIFVPEYWSGYLCIAFFIIATGCVALITARIVVLNGIERYPEKRPACVDPLLQSHDAACAMEMRDLNRAPQWLFELLSGSNLRTESWIVVIALIPSLFTFAYIILNSFSEGVRLFSILIGLGSGCIVALLFWYLVNALYYLAYLPPQPPAAGELLKLGKNAARTVLLPRDCFGLRGPGKQALDVNSCTLEDITTSLRSGLVARRLTCFATWLSQNFGLLGYFYNEGQPFNGAVFLYEGQLFSIIASGGFLSLFWILYPLTAPRYTRWSLAAFIALFLGFAWILRIILSGQCAVKPGSVRRWKIILCVLAGLFCASILYLWLVSSPDRFPTLGTILLMAIVLSWIFAGMAFFLDRYRIPVLTFFLLLTFLPRIFHVYDAGGFEEHYASTVPQYPGAMPLPTPAEVLYDRLSHNGNDSYPLVIITATGGGLHASSWTTHVIRQLYRTLPGTFPGHILLLSTVSGGSTGLFYYLQEIHANPIQPDLDHMVISAQCSSLEAVGWGLVYYDFTRALVPGAPWIIHPSPGESDLDASPVGKDRTWALRKAFARNSDDPYCFDSAETVSSQDSGLSKPSLDNWPQKKPWYSRPFSEAPIKPEMPILTVGELPAGAKFPAFTMNTTTVEAGDRFLLANYRLPAYRVGKIEGAAAESFLDIFCRNPRADLPLPTAAQLSAAFPYVSSAVRIPTKYTSHSVHFVDGGYYDDDGTSSAIEFLRYALGRPDSPISLDMRPDDVLSQEKVATALGSSPLKVLLIEIRNSEDTDVPSSSMTPKALDPGQHQDPNPWPAGLLQELAFPLEGFWNAGHGSITGRDRNGLDLVRSSLRGALDLHQIIFDDKTTPQTSFGLKAAQDPLSWSLTPRERAEVRRAADPALDPTGRLRRCYKAALDWFNDFQGHWDASNGDPPPTRCGSQP